jgi:hypothetical protein
VLLLLLLVVVLLLWLRVPAVVVVVSAATSGTAFPAGAIAGWVAGSGLVHGGSGVLEHGRERSRVPTVSPLRRAWVSLLDFGGGWIRERSLSNG